MSKSSNSSRNSSPRAMPVETIITRFKSAQQKRQLREMDRSMTKVTELLKNPVKSKIKKKEPHRKEQRLSSIIPLKDEGGKRSKKNKVKNGKEGDVEFCPMKSKRHVVLNKVRLKPKHDLKITASTNKRKRSVPQKGSIPEDKQDLTESSVSRDTSPKAKRLRPHQDMTMEEMIQLIEDSGSLNDEDLLEILTCPSPVWWEDPPDGYIEDALFTRPRSAAEMYPSIRSQLQEDLQERQRSSTPNVLSRRERVDRKSVPNKIEVAKKEEKEEESSSNNDNNYIDLEITLTKHDDKFIKKRSKLESVLGNLKNKAVDSISKVTKVEVAEGINSNNLSNKVSVIKNLCSKEVKVDGKSESGLSDNQVQDKPQVNVDKEEQAPVAMTTDLETDDEHLTDISFQEDSYLNDLENMDIPMEGTTDVAPKKEVEKISTDKTEILIVLPESKKKAEIFREPDNEYNRVDCTISNCSLNKCNPKNLKNCPIDPTYSDKKSSIIEDYFEMELFEEEDTIVNKKQNEYSKCGFKSVPTPLKCKNGKLKENNLKSSVIKFKNSDNTCINVFKIESVVPKNLPPLKTSDRRKNNVGCIPENLPPLRRNPGVIHLNSVSPKSCKSTTSFDSNSSVLQDNMDSISDTNICFLNEDDDDFCDGKKTDEFQGTVIKSSNDVRKNKSLNFIHTPNNEFLKKCNGDILPTELRFTEDEVLYRNFTNIHDVVSNDCNELEVQSLTITKVNDNCCCKVEKKLDAGILKEDVINCEKEQQKKITTNRKTDLTVESKKCAQAEFSTLIHNEIGKIENENSECITVYKIVSDDSGNDEPRTEPYIESPKDVTKDLKNTNDSIEKPDSNRDKMVFYFKKCKNLYWKHKIPDKIEDKKGVNEKDRTDVKHNKDTTDNIKNVKVTNTGKSEKEIKESRNGQRNVNYNNKTDKTNIKQYKKDTTDTIKNIKITNTSSFEEKEIKEFRSEESNVDYNSKTDRTNIKQYYKDTTDHLKNIKVTNTDRSEKEIKESRNGQRNVNYNSKTDRTNIKQYKNDTTDNVKNIKVTNTDSSEEKEINKFGNGVTNVDYNNKTDRTNIKQYKNGNIDYVKNIKVTNTDSSKEKEIKESRNGHRNVKYDNKTDRTNIKQYKNYTTDNVKNIKVTNTDRSEAKEINKFGNGESNVDYNNKRDRTNIKQYKNDTTDNIKNIKVTNTDSSEEKKINNFGNGESNVNYNDKTDRTNMKQYNKDSTDNVKNINVTDTSSSEKEIKKSENVESYVNHNNNLTTESKEQKCIIVSNTKQIRYCMKCSSIFDTAQCNYCYRKNSTDNKNLATDYLLKMQQCFVCDICRYKALSKDSLERHISSRCCDSKHR